MPKLKTYLIGSIQDSKDGGINWREELSKKLLDLGFEVLDPTKLECNHSLAPTVEEQKKKLENLKRAGEWDIWDKTMDAIQKEDIICVNASAFVIVFYNASKKLGGTIEEIIEALHKGVPIYTISYNSWIEWNDWTLRNCRKSFRDGGKIFHNPKQCIDHIKETYKDYIKVHGKHD